MRLVDSLDALKPACSGHRLLVVACGAAWCGNCRKIKPALKRLAAEVAPDGSGVAFVRVDVDESDDVAAAFNVASLPVNALCSAGTVLLVFRTAVMV